jgi:hypothetical protein
MRIRHSIALAITAGFVAAAAPAHATPQNFGVHGSSCTARKADRGRVDYSIDKGVFNTDTTTSAKVYCTVTANTAVDPEPESRLFVVSVVDNNAASGQDITCTLSIANNRNLATTFTSAPQKTTGAPGIAFLFFPDVPRDPFGWAVVSCTLPKKQTTGGAEPQIRGFLWSE